MRSYAETRRYSAWGLHGKDDQSGTLNRLTDDAVSKVARDEIQTGVRSGFVLDILIQ